MCTVIKLFGSANPQLDPDSHKVTHSQIATSWGKDVKEAKCKMPYCHVSFDTAHCSWKSGCRSGKAGSVKGV